MGDKPNTRSWAKCAGVIGLAGLTGFAVQASSVLVIGAIMVLSLHHDSPFSGRSFERTVWIASHDTDDTENPRGPMAEDLQKRFLADKPTRGEVISLLGEPDLMSEADKLRPDFLSYNLGMWSGLRIDYDSLDIYFDGDDRVRQVCIHRH